MSKTFASTGDMSEKTITFAEIGRDLYAFRYATNDNANTLYYRESGDNVLVVSEPLDSDRAHWKPVPPNHAIVAEAGKPVLLRPFLAEQRAAAE